MKFVLIPLILILAGCASGPTRVAEHIVSPQPAREPELLSATTRVLDVRPALEYASGHLPQASSVQWSDFSQPRSRYKGLLQSDKAAVARRLARLGVGPKSDVLVIGSGLNGHGEEGRVAWMLLYLGVTNVKTSSQDALKGRLATGAAGPVAGETLWDPEPDPTLLVSREELTKAQRPEVGRKKSADSLALEGEKVVIVDVRSEAEYLGMASKLRVPDMSAINIEWKYFYSADGRPNPAILPQLASVGIQPTQRLLVIDDEGVRSAAVTFALRQLGFARAGHYMGGLKEFLAR